MNNGVLLWGKRECAAWCDTNLVWHINVIVPYQLSMNMRFRKLAGDLPNTEIEQLTGKAISGMIGCKYQKPIPIISVTIKLTSLPRFGNLPVVSFVLNTPDEELAQLAKRNFK